jgi:hypothetical protein
MYCVLVGVVNQDDAYALQVLKGQCHEMVVVVEMSP